MFRKRHDGCWSLWGIPFLCVKGSLEKGGSPALKESPSVHFIYPIIIFLRSYYVLGSLPSLQLTV